MAHEGVGVLERHGLGEAVEAGQHGIIDPVEAEVPAEAGDHHEGAVRIEARGARGLEGGAHGTVVARGSEEHHAAVGHGGLTGDGIHPAHGERGGQGLPLGHGAQHHDSGQRACGALAARDQRHVHAGEGRSERRLERGYGFAPPRRGGD
jgi:hypothetical protein